MYIVTLLSIIDIPLNQYYKELQASTILQYLTVIIKIETAPVTVRPLHEPRTKETITLNNNLYKNVMTLNEKNFSYGI